MFVFCWFCVFSFFFTVSFCQFAKYSFMSCVHVYVYGQRQMITDILPINVELNWILFKCSRVQGFKDKTGSNTHGFQRTTDTSSRNRDKNRQKVVSEPSCYICCSLCIHCLWRWEYNVYMPIHFETKINMVDNCIYNNVIFYELC